MSKRRNRESAPKTKVRDIFVARPFEGLADEPEWVALRELVPAASAPLTLKPEILEEYGDRRGRELLPEVRRVLATVHTPELTSSG